MPFDWKNQIEEINLPLTICWGFRWSCHSAGPDRGSDLGSHPARSEKNDTFLFNSTATSNTKMPFKNT